MISSGIGCLLGKGQKPEANDAFSVCFVNAGGKENFDPEKCGRKVVLEVIRSKP
jgi:hypothetical protein